MRPRNSLDWDSSTIFLDSSALKEGGGFCFGVLSLCYFCFCFELPIESRINKWKTRGLGRNEKTLTMNAVLWIPFVSLCLTASIAVMRYDVNYVWGMRLKPTEATAESSLVQAWPVSKASIYVLLT